MDKNEVITLSSDEENDCTNGLQKAQSGRKPELKNSSEFVNACLKKFKNITVNRNKRLILLNKKQGIRVVALPKVSEKKGKTISKECPEVVDLECSEKSAEDEQVKIPDTDNKSPNENHSTVDEIDIVEIPHGDNATNNNEIPKPDVTDKEDNNTVPENIQTDTNKVWMNQGSDQNLKFFTEFVEHCGCLEEIPNDRARLTKKLMKRYGEADSNYIKSKEFSNLIQKCKDKVNKNNLYLIAKEITDELTYRKKFEDDTGKSNLVKETSQRDEEITVMKQECTKKSIRRAKVIRKIIKKLDKLGARIKQLEEEEVELSDEEDSSYVQLQRYRERFSQIYTKLCKYTNEVVDPDRVYNRKICFTESKYPAINKCIENWLNKTKRFPDFSDIMKLLESQSASLGLPSNRESIRAIAIEIFQQVGAMLQRRRKYDLWDSFCGYLDEAEDPAANDPLLDRVLRNNYETRIRKEQEIFKHFAELQEKERLEPEEVPDDEANHSPVESGNEDDMEIEAIEKSLNKRLDESIRKVTEEKENILENTDDKNDAAETEKDGDETVRKLRESKNNFRYCKSLKWRLENGVKSKSDSVNSEDSATGPETEKETQGKTEKEVNGEGAESKCDEETTSAKSELTGIVSKMAAAGCVDSPSKRKRDSDAEDGLPKRRKCEDKENEAKEVDLFEVDDNCEMTEKVTSEVFQVHCCQIIASNAFEDLNEKEKDWGKRKVFRDLTNLSRLMGRKRKTSGLFFSPLFFHQRFSQFETPSWKKRYKVSFNVVGLKGKKCAVNTDEKSGKAATPDSGGDGKNVEHNSEGAGEHEDGDNSHSGRGNGSEGDNNEDENKRNGRTGDEVNENQPEEDDEDEENETEKEEDNKADAESVEHSSCGEKTEEQRDGNGSSSNLEVKEDETTEESPSTVGEDLGLKKENTMEIDDLTVDETYVDLNTESTKENEEEENKTSSTEGEDLGLSQEDAMEIDNRTANETYVGLNTESAKENEEEEKKTSEEETKETPETGHEGVELLSEGKTDLCESSEVSPKEIEEINSEKGNEKYDTESTAENEQCDTESTAENEKCDTESTAENEKCDTVSTAENEKCDTESTAENEKCDTESTAENEQCDTESTAENEKCDTESTAENEQCDTESTAENEKCDAKITAENEQCDIEITAEDEKCDIVSTAENEKCDTESTAENAEAEKADGITKNQEEDEEDVKVEESYEESGTNEMETPKETDLISQSSNRNAEKPTPPRRPTGEKSTDKPTATGNEKPKPKRKAPYPILKKPLPVELPGPKPGMKRSTPSTSDEEIVKRFLLHSPSSISITPPRKLALSKPPSREALQALATLRNLKDISATIVRGGGKPKNEDDVVVIGGSYRRRVEQNSNFRKRRQTDLPVISNVQSGDSTTPKIVTVQGNVSGFDNSWADDPQCNSSSIRISNVWGSLPNSFMQAGQNSEPGTPGCSSRQQNNPGTSTFVRKKNAKKTVEYVVLE